MRAIATKQPTNDAAKQKKKGNSVRSLRSVSPLSTGMPFVQRKCACGGGCPRCQEDLGIQTKLKIGEPGDKYEQEADRIADEVMRMPEPSVQRQIELEEEEEEMIQRKAIVNSISSGSQDELEVPSIVHEVLRSPGQSLAPSTCKFMESHFGHDFSQVRVHTDAKAAKSAKVVGAIAYTFGRNVVFSAGQYSPSSTKGKKLLAHELTHVVQQGSSQLQQVYVNKRPDIDVMDNVLINSQSIAGLSGSASSISPAELSVMRQHREEQPAPPVQPRSPCTVPHQVNEVINPLDSSTIPQPVPPIGTDTLGITHLFIGGNNLKAFELSHSHAALTDLVFPPIRSTSFVEPSEGTHCTLHKPRPTSTTSEIVASILTDGPWRRTGDVNQFIDVIPRSCLDVRGDTLILRGSVSGQTTLVVGGDPSVNQLRSTVLAEEMEHVADQRSAVCTHLRAYETAVRALPSGFLTSHFTNCEEAAERRTGRLRTDRMREFLQQLNDDDTRRHLHNRHLHPQTNITHSPDCSEIRYDLSAHPNPNTVRLSP